MRDAPTKHYEGRIKFPSWMISYSGSADKFFLSAYMNDNIDINNDFSTMDEFC